jgi:hypothetical protein
MSITTTGIMAIDMAGSGTRDAGSTVNGAMLVAAFQKLTPSLKPLTKLDWAPLNLNQLSEDELKALIRKALKILIEKDLDLSEFIRKIKRINNG